MRNTVVTYVFNGNCVAATLSQTNHCQPLGDLCPSAFHLLFQRKHIHMYLCLNKNVKINLNTQVLLESQSFTNPFTMYQTFFTTMDVNLFFLCHQSLYIRLCRHVVELLTVFLLSLFFVINEAPGRVVAKGEPPRTMVCTLVVAKWMYLLTSY